MEWADEESDLRALVGNRFEDPRFARVAVELAATPFEAHLSLDKVHDRRAYHRVEYVNPYLAADLVTPRPEGLPELLVVGAALTRLTVNFSLVAMCAVADAPPQCMGMWTESEREKMARVIKNVDDNPELRNNRERRLATRR